jgi:SnoaL-like domain
MGSDALERQAIRELVEKWVLWRDAGEWERFRTVWHPDGRMMATWFQGTADQFIGVSREGFEKGVSILHFWAAARSIWPAAGPYRRPNDDLAARPCARYPRRRRLHRPFL